MEEEERRRRLVKLIKITLAVIIVIAGVSVPTYVYLTYLQPKPVIGVPFFRYEETRTVTAAEGGPSVTFTFNYQRVASPFKKAIIVLNVTSCTHDGTLEIRPLNYRLEVHTTDTFPKVGEVSFTEKQLYDPNILNVKEGESSITVINWGFEGTFQFIIYIESESA